MDTLIRFLAPQTRCEFLPEQTRQLEYEVVRRMTAGEYMTRMREGWRRFGHAMFRPVCPSCRACRSLRIDVAAFRPGRSQMRAWKANQHDVRLVVGSPQPSREKWQLFERFHAFQHEAKGWPSQGGEDTFTFMENPFATEEWCYYLDDRLIGVGYVDDLADGLSAIYFYYDPDERQRSLGTFNVLSLVEAARQRGLSHLYLGYYVRGCRSLEYKGRFRPSEVLADDGQWVPFTG